MFFTKPPIPNLLTDLLHLWDKGTKSIFSYSENTSAKSMCGGIGMHFLTHTIHTHTHTHNCMCTQHYFSTYLDFLYRPIACCCTEIASHTDSLCSCHLTRVKDEDESGGCSGRVQRSASCCIMYHVGVTNVVV